MIELGYLPWSRWKSPDWFRKHHHHLAPFYNPEKNIAIEIHHDILPLTRPFVHEISKIWERSLFITVAGIKSRTLCPNDLVIHLCLHLSSTDGSGFIGKIRILADISQVVRRYRDKIDWNLICSEAVEQNFNNYIYYPLHLAKELLNIQISADILNCLKAKSNRGYFEDFFIKKTYKETIISKKRLITFLPDELNIILKNAWLRYIKIFSLMFHVIRNLYLS